MVDAGRAPRDESGLARARSRRDDDNAGLDLALCLPTHPPNQEPMWIAEARVAVHPLDPVALDGSLHLQVVRIADAIDQVFDLRPSAIIDALDLRRPIYKSTAAYGHFGRELPEFTWEHTDKADALRAAAGLGEPAAV